MKLHYIKHLLMMLLVFIPFVGIQAQEYMNVYLTSQNAFRSISIDEIDKITFPSEDEVSITLLGIATPMAIEDIEVITFGDTDITAIEESEAEVEGIEITYLRGKGEIKVTSSEAIALVQLYNMQGVLMQTQTPNTQIATLDVSNYANGIYIVAVQSSGKTETKKFIK
ncbi:MAG: T9SS type A sorting domain-containing protein [Bacteroidales bacterium]|nr:T9SS type A sorting domain-containing protein [Bacteroidales bacterium]